VSAPSGLDLPVPPAELRHRVAGEDSAARFLERGRASYHDLARALAGVGRSLDSFERILDWGCGCGRVTRWLREDLGDRELVGVDIDSLAIRWCAQYLPFGRFVTCEPRPPLDFPDAHFDLVINHSVLSHLDRSMQDEWLAELHRIVRPGGLIVLSVQGDSAFAAMSASWGSSRAAERRRVLETDGLLHITDDEAGSPFPDFYRSTFHATWYVFAHWAQRFPIRAFYPRGALSFQDVVVLERPGSDQAPDSPIVPARGRGGGESSGSVPAGDHARLRSLIDAGPPAGQPTRYGSLTRFVRRVMRRATSSTQAHQRDVDRQLLAALGDLEQTVARLDHAALVLRGGLSQQSERLTRLEHQVADQQEG